MKIPEKPHDEEHRLSVLHALNILDTPAEERFDRVTRLARRLFDTPFAFVTLVDNERVWVKSAAGMNVQESPRDLSFCGHAILGSDIFIIPDTTRDERFSDHPAVTDPPCIRFYAGAPLRYTDGSKLGTLCIVDTTPRQLTDEDIEVMRDLAKIVERELIAVQLATLDDLTKLSNRRGFLALAKQSLNFCARQNIPASLVLIDLNDFKAINDNFGHAAGDRVLVAFAEQMKAIFRDSDVVARLGGDEFSVLLSGILSHQAPEIVERFRKSIASYFAENMPEYSISFSVGIKTLDLYKGYSLEDLLEQADHLMYQNKTNNKK